MKCNIISGLALSALLIAAPLSGALAAKAPPPPPPVWSWTGFYGGGNIGYSWGDGKSLYNNPAFALTTPPLPTSIPETQRLDGLIGGVQIGYNWQANSNWVLGVETDFQGSGEKGSSSVTDPYVYYYDFPAFTSGTLTPSFSTDIRWFGTLRGRVGLLATPTMLLYGTGGLAYGRISSSGSVFDSYAPSPFTWSFGASTTKTGWTVGAGLEGAVPNASNWTWKVEYLYIDFGTVSGSGTDPDWGPYSWSTRVTDNILRVGLNYHFGGPVVAKY